MAVTGEMRHQLYKALEDSIGVENASTLMDFLPPAGWADVAMRRDLDQLEQRIDMRIQNLELSLEGKLERELRHQTNVFVTWMIAANATMASAILAAVKLL
jgi:hypothetical protein